MIKIFYTLLLSILVLTAKAQINTTSNADVIWGDELKFKKGDEFSEYLGKDTKKHYLIKYYKGGYQYEINVFGNDMKLLNTALVDMKYESNNKMSYDGAYLLKNSIFIFSSYADKKEKINRLFYRKFDKNNLKGGELVEVGQLPYEKKKAKGDFGIEFSEDKSRILIYLGKPYQKNAPEKFGFSVLDSELAEIWKKEIELPYTEQFFTIEDHQVNNDGDVYLLGKEYNENKKDRIKGIPNYKYHILAYLDNGKKIKDYEINLEDKFITDITYKIAENGDLICSGLYSKNGTSSVKGAFYMTIDFETRQVKNNSVKEFDENFITQGWSDRAIAKAKKKEIKKDQAIELYEYDLKDFVLRKDGGAILLAEQYYVRVVTTTSRDANGNVSTTTTYHYYYNDIIVVNISPSGQIEWATKVDKRQHSINDSGYLSSYVLHVKEDKLHLIYNEYARVYFEKDERKQLTKKERKSYLTVVVTIDKLGNQQKDIIINASKESTYPVPKFSEQINEKELLIYTRKQKKRKFAIINFK